MQSTHNTIGSLVAIDARCHGYNATYAHKGISFECALSDAFLQLRAGRVATALVGAHDEMTPDYFTLLTRAGYLGQPGDGFSGETAVSMMLDNGPGEGALCRLRGMDILYCPDREELTDALDRLARETGVALEEIDAVMVGTNGVPANDRVYAANCPALFPGKPLARYKHLFGESYTAPGLGVYAAATCLHRRHLPACLLALPGEAGLTGVKHLLFYNQFEDKNHSFILLSSCGE
jgi:3-oxoacyl-(acyl-carrier-protein) synthase